MGNLPKIQRFKFERASFRSSGGRGVDPVDRLLVIGRRDALVKGRPCYRESRYRESFDNNISEKIPDNIIKVNKILHLMRSS